jgi:DNA modification methylase
LRDYGVEGQIGLEKIPEEFIDKMVEVFSEVYRVLKDDGTLWLNLGDSYNGGGTGGPSDKQLSNAGSRHLIKTSSGLKPGNLVGIPWRTALALRDFGWVLRSDIIWAKPAPMPESIKNRCTKSHEYLFMFVKKMGYYFNHEAIKEKATPGVYITSDSKMGSFGQAVAKGVNPSGNGKPGTIWETGDTRNKRDVWNISSENYGGAHFATFPTKLVEPCILSGSKEGDTILDPFIGSGTTCSVSDYS